MKVITSATSKGGAGKSTLFIGIASVLHRRGHKTLVLDLDEQGSLAGWLTSNDGSFPLPDPNVLTVESGYFSDDDRKNTAHVVRRMKEIDDAAEHEFLLIDTKGETARLTAAIGARSDVVLCPTVGHSLEFEPTILTYKGLRAVLAEMGEEDRIDDIFRVVINRRKAAVEAAAVIAAQNVIRSKFRTINGPMESTSYNEAHEYGTTIDRLLETATLIATNGSTPKIKAAAKRARDRHAKTLALLEQMVDEILGNEARHGQI